MEVPGTIYKPRMRGVASSSIQFEDGTEVFDVGVVILTTGYDYRFPFLNPSDSHNRSARELLRRFQRVVETDVRVQPKMGSKTTVVNLDMFMG